MKPMTFLESSAKALRSSRQQMCLEPRVVVADPMCIKYVVCGATVVHLTKFHSNSWPRTQQRYTEKFWLKQLYNLSFFVLCKSSCTSNLFVLLFLKLKMKVIFGSSRTGVIRCF